MAPFAAVALGVAWLSPAPAAGEALIAVATNFAEPAERLAAAFEAETAHEITIATGSTGTLYAQIVYGAPFDALLAADGERPARLVADGHALRETRFTYAVGRLALWSAEPGRVAQDGRTTLREGRFRKLALANPELAPYGAAARETLASLGLAEALADRVVLGENVGQAHALVATRNAELGFVALSSLVRPGQQTTGSRWDVPPELHAPIRQDAVLLTRAAANPAARAFLDSLRGADARRILAAYGYGVE